MIAMSEPGIRGWIRGAAIMITATSATSASGAGGRRGTPCRVAWTAETAALPPVRAWTPNAAGTCWRKMITAIPTVNPSITGQGSRRHDPAELEQPGGDDDHPGQDGHRGQGPDALGGDDRTQDDDHRPGRAGNLDVGATEDGGDHAGDHGGDQSAGRSGAGADPEGQRQREGDDAHGDPGDEVPFPGAGQLRIVLPAGQKRPGRGQGLHRELPVAAAHRGRGRRMFELLAGGVQHVVEQQTCHGQQVSDLRVRQGIEHLQGPAFALHQVVTAQHGQMLGQMRGLQTGRGEHVSHGHLRRLGTAAPVP